MGQNHVNPTSRGDPIRNAIAHAVRAWQRSDYLCESPSRQGEPEGAVVSESLVSRPEEFESHLLPLLNHKSPLVAAYSLLTLHRMRSLQLQIVPRTLFERREPLRIRRGCFAATIDLGSFARRITNDPHA